MGIDDGQPDAGNDSLPSTTVVIVGGGIGGLACALALHRVGIKSVVLEQSETLRAYGTMITLWSNAFRVLDVLGVGEQFRAMYINVQGWEVFNQRGKLLAGLELADCEGGPHEMRALERKVLLETLAGQLPQGTIRLNSRVTSIRELQSRTGVTEVELQNGSTYSAKVVIGFDGVNSVVASWMGIEKAIPVGQVGIRGMAIFPDNHKFEQKVCYYVGKGIRSSYLPSTATKVYWFIFWNETSEGSQDNTPEQIKQEALQRAEAFQSDDLRLCINNTPPENFTKNTIRHRLNIKPTDSQVVGCVTLAGDASHPTTPNLGQGGCMALEDAIIITQKLYGALKTQDTQDAKAMEHERIHAALLEFQRERHERTYTLSVKSHAVGSIMQSDWSLVCFYRDWYLIPKSLNETTFLGHTLFDVGKLP